MVGAFGCFWLLGPRHPHATERCEAFTLASSLFPMNGWSKRNDERAARYFGQVPVPRFRHRHHRYLGGARDRCGPNRAYTSEVRLSPGRLRAADTDDSDGAPEGVLAVS